MPEVSAATGRFIATVWEEWPGRNLSVDPLPDDAIIRHLGDMGGRLAFWITQDWSALGDFRELIDAHRISVLWLRGPEGRSLKRPEQLLLAGAVLDTVWRLAMDDDTSLYLRARFAPGGGTAPAPMLERLAGSLLEAPLRWVAAPLG